MDGEFDSPQLCRGESNSRVDVDNPVENVDNSIGRRPQAVMKYSMLYVMVNGSMTWTT